MKPTHVQRYIDVFESLTPLTLQSLEDCFAEDARFVDPFNDVRGHAAIRAVFAHMFEQCEQPVFRVGESVSGDGVAYLRWTFAFGPAGRRRTIEGVSRVSLDAAGLVEEHIDYWDPASQLYESIPFLGGLLRRLRRKLSADGHQQHTRKPDHTRFATER